MSQPIRPDARRGGPAARRRRLLAAIAVLSCLAVPAVLAQEAPITEYRLPPDALARSEALYRTTIAITIASTVYGVALLVGLLVLRVAPRFRDLAERVSSRRFVQALVFVPLLLLTIDVLSLPVSVYGHSLQVRYGLSVQGWGSWFWDWTKGELLGTALATLLVWACTPSCAAARPAGGSTAGWPRFRWCCCSCSSARS